MHFQQPRYQKQMDFWGKLNKNYFQDAKLTPHSKNLGMKYLVEVFESHVEEIKSQIQGKKITIIVDESPDLLGRPTVNVFASYSNEKDQNKKVFLIDMSFVRNLKSTSIMEIICDFLHNYGKTFNDVLVLASDSAQNMVKLVQDINESGTKSIFHIKDIAHLIHVAVDKAVNIDELKDLRDIIIKTGAMFQHSAK